MRSGEREPRDLRAARRPHRHRPEAHIDSLVYLSLGTGRHVAELRFSVLSAARLRAPERPFEIVLYTDDPSTFDGLPVETRVLDAATMGRWAGPHGYVYRAKIAVLEDALTSHGADRAAVIDADTYFTRSPSLLFDRVAAGRTVMHVREGQPAPPEVAAFGRVLAEHRPADGRGRPWGLDVDEVLWNSGVVALHRSDAHLCQSVTGLTDQLLDHGFADHSHIAEMAAFGVVLSRRSQLRECFDVVSHYWPTELRAAFGARLEQVWSDQSLTQEQAFERLWQERPRPSAKARVKFRVKRMAAKAGVEL